MLGLIFQMFFLQAVAISVIVFVLKILLDKQLQEDAVHRFEVLSNSALEKSPNEIVVTVTSSLKEVFHERILRAFKKKTSQDAKIVVTINKNIKGGLVIQCGRLIIDSSLTARLKESGLMRP